MLDLWLRIRNAYAREGMPGVFRRIVPYLRRFAIEAPQRLGLRVPRLSVIVLAEDQSSVSRLERELAERQPPRRWLEELLIVSSAPMEHPARVDQLARRVRWLEVPAKDPIILINAGVASARGHFVAFAPDGDLSSWRLLRTKLLRGMRSPDVVCPGSAGNAEGEPRFEELGLSDVLMRRRTLIQIGLFRPEQPSGFVEEALTKLWSDGFKFAFLSADRWSQASLPPREASDDDIDERAPRVVYFVNGTDVRGGIRIVFEHCNRLRTRGIDALIASFDEPVQSWFPELRAPLISVRDLSPMDVAVATFWTTANYVAQLDCARFYFIQHDEALFQAEDWWGKEVRQTYRLPLDFITISSWLVDHIREEAGKEATLVPNGINREMFYPDPAYPRGDRLRVLVEGKGEIDWKGLRESQEALEGLDVEVWALGDTGVRADREFLYPPQDELRRIYSNCDILLKTSWYEGMPLPHMEAMACGCALVTTDVPGVRDYCIDGWNCLTAEPRNVADIREKLTRLLEDPELRAKLVENGLRTAQEFEWDEKVDMLENLYREAALKARKEYAAGIARRKDPSGLRGDK